MLGARGDALEWALALAQSPGERYVLRQRPLPQGIESLLHLAAAGAGPVLAEAVARSGEPADGIVEASRFYLREVLFFQGADAYRVLGLDREASDAQLKAHHRLLQQWLHPDRHTSDWDAIFAARVNGAWNQLRTAERRAAYDAEHEPPKWTPADAEPWRGGVHLLAANHVGAETDEHAHWRRRAPVMGLFAACALLGALALLDANRVPASDLGEVGLAEDASPAGASRDPVLSVPSRRPPTEESAVIQPTRSRVAHLASGNVVAAKPAPVVEPVVLKRAVPARVATGQAPPTPNTPSVPTRATALDKRLALSESPSPSPVRVPESESRPAVARVVQRPPSPTVLPPAGTATAFAPSAGAQPEERAVATAPAFPANGTAGGTEVTRRPKGSALATSAERASQAQQIGDELLVYLSGRRKLPPPIWDHLPAQIQASRLRQEFARDRLHVGESNWRVDDKEAVMLAEVTPSPGASRQLRVDFVWREQQWLVRGVALEGGS